MYSYSDTLSEVVPELTTVMLGATSLVLSAHPDVFSVACLPVTDIPRRWDIVQESVAAFHSLLKFAPMTDTIPVGSCESLNGILVTE